MKKTRLIWFLVLSTIIISCSNNDLSSSENNTKNVKESFLMGNKIFNKLESDKDFMTIKGEFYVWQNKENEIVFISKDNTNRNLLILQGADKTTSLSDGNYEILYLKHSILVNNLDTHSKTYLKVPKTEEYAITSKIREQGINFDSEIDGFGLILSYIDYKNDKDLSLEILKNQNSVTDYFTNLHQTRSQCGSGGVGSTSCTVFAQNGGGCSVSCGAGYYACCNLDCVCNPNPPS